MCVFILTTRLVNPARCCFNDVRAILESSMRNVYCPWDVLTADMSPAHISGGEQYNYAESVDIASRVVGELLSHNREICDSKHRL